MENLDFLQEILMTSSPSGDTKVVMEKVRKKFEELGKVEINFTNKGAMVVTLRGETDEKQSTFAAHVDTLGLMVKEIKPNGRLKTFLVGGYAYNSVENEYVTISTMSGKKYTGTCLNDKQSVHVYGPETRSNERNAKTMEIRIDEKVESAEDVEKLGINVGDFIYLDSRTQLTESGFVKSRHLDDKACVYVLYETVRYFVENNITPKHTLNFFISNYEEVGHGACYGIPEETDEFIVVDMAAPGDGQTSSEFKTTICAADSSGPYDLELKERLVRICEENNIHHAVDIYPFYSSDGSAALEAGYNLRVALIGPGVDASHAMERTHQEGLQASIDLCIKYIEDKK
ncbi:M42 family metallopeptidase [Finegoldia magna]|uniref:M42 family metallopeptidase n=1 Tax=Finegoldia magna TaxID=1260 RepID=UPI000B91CD88|nr:M42 family metallopeptidase [Finegoldia magna]OXZ36444.1 aminopeptidase [Finegoldia magna]